MILTASAFAEGFNTCTIAQSDIGTKAGIELPLNRAYQNVCIAVLPPTCGNYTVEHKPCAYRACLVPDNVKRCPNGEPPSYTAATIEPYVAKPVKPLSPGELAEMNRKVDAEARRLAAKWTDNGRVPLAPAALTALQNMSCQLIAASNPDVRCVPR